MQGRDYFKDIYKDFFGIENNINKSSDELVKLGSQEEMASLFERINNLYIDSESKDLLKKIIEYMRKYSEGLEKVYIPFRIITVVNNKEVKESIENILKSASEYFNYVINKNKKEVSLYNIDKDLKLDNFGMVSFNDINGLSLEDLKEQTKFIYTLEEFLKKEIKSIVIISGSKNEIDDFFTGKEKLRNQYFNFKINGLNPDINDIYNYKLDNIELSDENKIKLLDYISETYNEFVDYISYK